MKKIKKLVMKIVGFIIGGICGALIVIILPSTGLLNLLAGIILLVIGFVLHVFIHEAGHFVAGKISGYDFVSIRFFSLMFVMKDRKLTRKKYNIAGTAGQCLMSPPVPVNGKFPFILYNLGGVLMNCIFSVLFLVLYFIFSTLSASGSWLFILFAIVGTATVLLNILPINLGFPTDGYNVLTLGKNKIASSAFWLILYINDMITKGVRHRDIPTEHFYFLDSVNWSDNKNLWVISAEINRFECLVDRHDFKEAKALAERLLHTANKMLGIQKNELLCELLFLELIGECRKEEIDRLYTEDIKKYIKATSTYPARQRLMYAYSKLFLNDNTEVAKILEKFNKTCLSYPFDGEIARDREMISLIENLAEKRSLNDKKQTNAST